MVEARTWVVTGASAGVGRAIARVLGARGERVALLARDEERLESARAEVESLGGRAVVVPADVAVAEEVEAAAGRVEEELGPIDVWVNNAMTTVFAPFVEVRPEEFRRATEVTYLGTVYGTMAALRRMVPRDRGTVVQVGSALAHRAIPLQSAYCGAKHAVRGFTDSIRSELIRDGSRVHVTMVQLPALNTPQFQWCRTRLPRQPQPVPPIYQPEVAAEAVVWSADHRRREVAVGLSSLLAIWGGKLVPGYLDRRLARTAIEDQQTDQHVDPERPDNLFEPVPGEYGAHGIFEAESRSLSPFYEVNARRGWIAVGIAALASGVLLAGLKRGLADL